MEEFYKVVRIRSGEMISVNVEPDSPYCVTYTWGEQIHASIGGLFVFATREHAVSFVSTLAPDGWPPNYHILKVRGARQPWPARDGISRNVTPWGVERYWLDEYIPGLCLMRPPPGTVLCSWIALLADVT